MDWYLLRSIVQDASGLENDLASRLGDRVVENEVAQDWKDIVVPDLREAFVDDLNHVGAMIEAAFAFRKAKDTKLEIPSEEAMIWFSALNQARLSLEERYSFEDNEKTLQEELDTGNESSVRSEALFRNNYYSMLQTYLLENLITS